MRFHREGKQTLLLVGSASSILLATALLVEAPDFAIYALAGLSLFLLIVVLQFFRVPERKLTLDQNLIVAPADGKVVVIEEVVEPEYLKRACRQVSIFMSPINVHQNLNPVSGTISYAKYHEGLYLVAWHPKSSTENERTSIAYRMGNGTEIMLRQIAGALARRICYYVKPGMQVAQGEEFGFIKFGSRVDIFIPLDAEVLVNLNQVSYGGITPIARLKS